MRDLAPTCTDACFADDAVVPACSRFLLSCLWRFVYLGSRCSLIRGGLAVKAIQCLGRGRGAHPEIRGGVLTLGGGGVPANPERPSRKGVAREMETTPMELLLQLTSSHPLVCLASALHV